jgi:hypothetical protein
MMDICLYNHEVYQYRLSAVISIKHPGRLVWLKIVSLPVIVRFGRKARTSRFLSDLKLLKKYKTAYMTDVWIHLIKLCCTVFAGIESKSTSTGPLPEHQLRSACGR